jgi:ribonuclease P protein component
MRAEQRLQRQSDFAAAYKEGRAHSHRLLVVRVRPNGLEHTRFGFVAGKVVGGAVVRNRLKRRLRAMVRQMPVRGGYDIVIGARKPSVDAGFPELREALRGIFERAGCLAPGEGA